MLEAAKDKLFESAEPFPLEDLPKSRDDPLWNEIKIQYDLSIAEISALKAYSCTRLQACPKSCGDSITRLNGDTYADPQNTSAFQASATIGSIAASAEQSLVTPINESVVQRQATSVNESRRSSSIPSLSVKLPVCPNCNKEFKSKAGLRYHQGKHVCSNSVPEAAIPEHRIISTLEATSYSVGNNIPYNDIDSSEKLIFAVDSKDDMKSREKRKRKKSDVDGDYAFEQNRASQKVFEVSRRARFDMLKAGFIRYRELTGRNHVPKQFIVPIDETWDAALHGVKLGLAYKGIRRHGSYKAFRQELADEGFDIRSTFFSGYDPRVHGPPIVQYLRGPGDPPPENYQRFEDESIFTALRMYKEKNGHMLVPTRYMIPADPEEWPADTWNMKLGSYIHEIRRGNRMRHMKAELEEIGFDFSPQRRSHGFQATYSTLAKYKEIHGSVKVPKTFVVPSNDPQWPQETWGFPLGRQTLAVRKGINYYDKKAMFEELGLEFRKCAELLPRRGKRGEMKIIYPPISFSSPDAIFPMTHSLENLEQTNDITEQLEIEAIAVVDASTDVPVNV